MIRLTLNPQLNPEIHLFSKSIILVGANPTSCDLTIHDLKNQPIALRFSKEKEKWTVANLTNDPFASLNDLPFGEKKVQSGDLITVGKTSILFEILPDQEREESLSESQAKSPNLPDDFEIHPGNGIEPFKKGEWNFSELESFKGKDLTNEKGKQKRSSLKDDYLRDLDDENRNKEKADPFGHQAEPSHLFQAWKSILFIIFILFALAGLIAALVSISLNTSFEEDETKAIQGVSDVAIALVDGHLSQVKHQHHNWSDPEFLKTRLQQILPTTFSYASHIDAQGQFNCCPYTLRIYTNSDLSRFVLIAQPAPTLFYWPIPKPIIVVDSHLMELRSLKDVRSLNRLVANADPLEGSNGHEITALIKQGALIKLSSISVDQNEREFTPPHSALLQKDGADNLIYNAPRYYHLTKEVMKKITHFSSLNLSPQEIKSLKKDLERLSHLDNLILYSVEGKAGALKARRELTTLTPDLKFMFGYLSIDQTGKITQAALLDEDDINSEIALINASIGEEQKNIQRPFDSTYTAFQDLFKERQIKLTPLTASLVALLKREKIVPVQDFKEELENLLNSYFEVNELANKLFFEKARAVLKRENPNFKEEAIQEFLDLFDPQKSLMADSPQGMTER